MVLKIFVACVIVNQKNKLILMSNAQAKTHSLKMYHLL